MEKRKGECEDGAYVKKRSNRVKKSHSNAEKVLKDA